MSNKKAIVNALTGVLEYVDESAEDIADREQRHALIAQQQADETAKADDAAKVIDALPSKEDVKGAKSVSALAEEVAKQGELLALIAAKLGLI